MLVLVAGQTLDARTFQDAPLFPDPQGALFWERFRLSAEQEKNNVPAHAKGAVGKHAFTTSGHVTACHILCNAFRLLKDHRDTATVLDSGGSERAQRMAELDLGEAWRRVPADLFLAAPEHVHFMLQSILVAYNEMKLPAAQRAGAETLDEASASTGRRRAQSAPGPSVPPLSKEEEVLKMLLQRFLEEPVITVTMVNTVVPRRCNVRSNQAEIARIFDEAQKHNAGVREGEPNTRPANLRLRLTLENMSAKSRVLFSLPAVAAEAPPMNGAGSLGLPNAPLDGLDVEQDEDGEEQEEIDEGAAPLVMHENYPRKPNSKQAWALLCDWASDPDRSGEPFKLELHPAQYWGTSLARGVCTRNTLCRRHPKCKFSVCLSFEQKEKRLVFTKKNVHCPEDERKSVKLKKGFSQVGQTESREKAPS